MVLATASSDERLERLKPLGLTHGINYSRDDVVQEVEAGSPTSTWPT